jgi:hypothetical protein
MLFYFFKKSLKQRLNKLFYRHKLSEDWIVFKLYIQNFIFYPKEQRANDIYKINFFLLWEKCLFIVEFIRNIKIFCVKIRKILMFHCEPG